MREPLEVMKKERLLLRFGKVVHEGSDFLPDGLFSGIHGRIHLRTRDGDRPFPSGLLGFPGSERPCGIEGNAIKPGPERKFSPETFQPPEHSQECFLGGILGPVRVAEEPQKKGIDAVVISTDQLAQGCPIPTATKLLGEHLIRARLRDRGHGHR
jgi:hypothetical protein